MIDEPDKEPDATKIVKPSTRVNVAFPFSNIHIQQSSGELAELADIVNELAELVASLHPHSRATELSEKAMELAERLGN